MYKRILNIPMYNMMITLIIHNNFDEVDKEYNLPNDDSIESKGFTIEKFNKTKLNVLIVLKEDLELNTIFHEMSHIKSYLIKYRLREYNPDFDEAIAYFEGYVFEQLFKSIDQFKYLKNDNSNSR